MDQRLSLITLGVADLARARAFYEQGLGWAPLQAMDEIAFYQLPGLAFGLFERKALAWGMGIRQGRPPIARHDFGGASAGNLGSPHGH